MHRVATCNGDQRQHTRFIQVIVVDLVIAKIETEERLAPSKSRPQLCLANLIHLIQFIRFYL